MVCQGFCGKETRFFFPPFFVVIVGMAVVIGA